MALCGHVVRVRGMCYRGKRGSGGGGGVVVAVAVAVGIERAAADATQWRTV